MMVGAMTNCIGWPPEYGWERATDTLGRDYWVPGGFQAGAAVRRVGPGRDYNDLRQFLGRIRAWPYYRQFLLRAIAAEIGVPALDAAAEALVDELLPTMGELLPTMGAIGTAGGFAPAQPPQPPAAAVPAAITSLGAAARVILDTLAPKLGSSRPDFVEVTLPRGENEHAITGWQVERAIWKEAEGRTPAPELGRLEVQLKNFNDRTFDTTFVVRL